MNKSITFLSLILYLLLAGCSGQPGTAEKLGKEIDKSIENSKETLHTITEKAAEKIEHIEHAVEKSTARAEKNIDETLEKAAEKIEEVVEAAKEKTSDARSHQK
ncbi:hypothetical protein ABF87_12230 [Nitrosomonas sp. JL21]|uniref:hypothetical protein n=1 Tax=Nitrosomonas sp. JL21 TaxID=153949 RepID=UPI00136BE6B0|nr:hypothetical protein [Nitrosomonas sp. JL21]MBL8497406.1 hypothetical protein [Nitrosomonas sp.]MCC7090523.1 hypothetical protein [Nitrosomonas sp.]MXS78708.1 hypothetical protein [Nitrosomonas sp. JL21]